MRSERRDGSSVVQSGGRVFGRSVPDKTDPTRPAGVTASD